MRETSLMLFQGAQLRLCIGVFEANCTDCHVL